MRCLKRKLKKPMELCLQADRNVISMNALDTIIASVMEKSKLGEAGFDEHHIFSPPSTEEIFYFDDTMPPIYDNYNNDCVIFSPPTIEEEINYDDNMPPIFDDYCDENNIDCYFVEFAPTSINKNDYAYVESINYFMHVDHDKNFSADAYIVEFINDATESYYERGKHGYIHLNNIKFPLYKFKFLKFHLFCLPMLATLCFIDLFFYKIPLHRKWVRLKCVSYLLLDALFSSIHITYVSIFSNYHVHLNGYKERAFGRQPIVSLFSVVFLFVESQKSLLLRVSRW